MNQHWAQLFQHCKLIKRCVFGDLATATQMRQDRDFFYRCQANSWDCRASEYPFRRSAISAELVSSVFKRSVCRLSRPLLFMGVATAHLHFNLDSQQLQLPWQHVSIVIPRKNQFFIKYYYFTYLTVVRSCQLWHIRGHVELRVCYYVWYIRGPARAEMAVTHLRYSVTH